MSTATQFPTLSAARAGFKDLLDAAEEGRPATVRREHKVSAVVDAARLRCMLAAGRPAEAQIVAEAGGWSIFLPGLSLAADAASFDEVLVEIGATQGLAVKSLVLAGGFRDVHVHQDLAGLDRVVEGHHL